MTLPVDINLLTFVLPSVSVLSVHSSFSHCSSFYYKSTKSHFPLTSIPVCGKTQIPKSYFARGQHLKITSFLYSLFRNPKILQMGGNDLASNLGLKYTAGSAASVNISSIVMVVSVIFLFLLVIFLFLFHFYRYFYWLRRATARRRASFIFAADAADAADAPNSTRGLDAAILRSLPVTVYKRSEFKEGLECAVCLSELSDGEVARLLPKCDHGFHLECIDMWFYSHSTCPLCRSPVVMESSTETPMTESSELPTNVLLCVNQDQVSAQRLASQSERSSERMLVISIPARSAEGIFAAPAPPLPSSSPQTEEMKSPVEIGSLKRLFRTGKRIGGSSCSSPGVGDIEQGLVGYGPSKAEGNSVIPKSPISSL